MNKTCNKCHEEKSLDQFAKGSKYIDGRRNYCKQCHSKYVTQYIKNNPQKRSKSNPNRKFKRHGLTEEQYYKYFNKYNGMCHACKDRDGINIDHDHRCCPGPYSCGKCVRGVLCNQCNTSLGLMGDSITNIKKLIEYIDL